MTVADAPTTWADQPSFSTLETLLVFAGIPLFVVAIVSLLVVVPSLVKGPGQSPTESWDAESEWFGLSDRTGAAVEPGPSQAELESHGAARDTGGASARW